MSRVALAVVFATGLALLAWGLVALDKPAVTVGVGALLVVCAVGAGLPGERDGS